jgi:dCTP deaminase
MVIIGENLKSLVEQHSIVECENFNLDETSIPLRLDNNIIDLLPPKEAEFSYGDEIPKEWIKERKLKYNESLSLKPNECVLACSYEKINMPNGYFGFIQTKGSLARLFVTIHCCDAQVDPGFNGKITYEIINFSKMTIKIKPKQLVGNLYIFKCSTKNAMPYNGRYNESEKPTIQKPEY